MIRTIFLCVILILIGLMSALESEPCEAVGFIKYECVTTNGTDLNLIAIPLDAGYTMASDLGNAIGADVINAWDAAGQGWLSASNLGFMWVDDFEIVEGGVYLVNILEDTDVYIAGEIIVQPNYSLVTTTGTDLNLVMCPIDRSDLTMASEIGDDIGVCDVVSKWDALGQGWQSASNLGFMWVDDFPLSIGDPLMVNVTSEIVWPFVDAINSHQDVKTQTSEKVRVVK